VQGVQGAKAVHHAVSISRQRNNGYKLSRVNMLWQKVSPLPSPDPLSPYAHLSNKGRSRNNYTTHHEASLMVCYTTLVLSLEMRIGPACEAGFGAGMRREHVLPRRRKKERSA